MRTCWHMDALHVLVDVDGCVACPHGCGWWMGVWTHCMSVQMHCVRTDEGKEKKEKKRKKTLDEGGGRG